jgi:hypothetical protein
MLKPSRLLYIIASNFLLPGGTASLKIAYFVDFIIRYCGCQNNAMNRAIFVQPQDRFNQKKDGS